MRGNLTTRKLVWLGVLGIVMLAFGLNGCAALERWEESVFAGTVVADASTPDASAGDTGSSGGGSPEEPAGVTVDGSPMPPAEETVRPSPPPARKQIALTFDDGPDSNYTPRILDLLKEYDAKATFFLVGSQVRKFPDVAARIVEEGHSVGNHTWAHADLTKLSAKALNEQVDRAREAIAEAAGLTPQLVRAPYGAVSDAVLKAFGEAGMTHVGWTVDTKDWAGTSVATMRENVAENARDGGIILMHSFGGRKGAIEHTVELLPLIIEDLRANGFELVTVEELIESGRAIESAIKLPVASK
ncbi:polysaccharide deacetylase family protein [Paenibacillaceae bacterium WGS1546]|uniref:polysaccharide deacetylase family protein n=1 Tax=Cohnella sp. WGS1546 TaxID=3366810 RepID=UPI00372D58E3